MPETQRHERELPPESDPTSTAKGGSDRLVMMKGPANVLDAKWRYRCTFLYGDDVVPPGEPGGVDIQTVHADRLAADLEVQKGRDRAHVGRILIEERLGDTVVRGNLEPRDQWRTVATWTRRAEGWRRS